MDKDSLLSPGQQVRAVYNANVPCTIARLHSRGGQGELYEARLGTTRVAVKWYPPDYLKIDLGLRERLAGLIKWSAPSAEFIWPFDLAEFSRADSFGYIMPWLPENFRGLGHLLHDELSTSIYAIATMGFHLAHAFGRLHVDSEWGGHCYRDINDKNIAVDPDTGDVRIMDNDNVDVTGRPGVVRGMVNYMAPEVIRNQHYPDAETDYYSLAVLLFNMLFRSHPLEGLKELQIMTDPAGLVRLYGSEPLFIFDPQDSSNRPIPGTHDNAVAFWKFYPAFLRDLFTRAFTFGLSDRNRRVPESQWCSAMIRLRDSLFDCPAAGCGVENCYDVDYLQQHKALQPCWNCGSELPLPPRMCFANDLRRVFVLKPGAQLYAHHLEGHDYDLEQPLAEVTAGTLALRNLSERNWYASRADGWGATVPPRQIVPLEDRMSISFGLEEGKVSLLGAASRTNAMAE